MKARPKSSSLWNGLPIAAGALFAALAVHAASVETPTVDEFAHVPAGLAYLEHGSFELYAKNPPLGQSLVALPLWLAADVAIPQPRDLSQGWGPWRYGTRFMSVNEDVYLGLFRWARAVPVGLVLLTGALVFAWARQLFGTRAAAFSTSLFFSSPLVLAHGHLATVDAAAMATVVATAFALRWALSAPGVGRVAAAGAAWGVALLVKFSAGLLAPAIAAMVVVYRFPSARTVLRDLAAIALSALLLVNLGMGFQGSFHSLSEYELGSGTGRAAKEWLPAWLPIPVPKAYVVGFDAVKRDTEEGEFGSYLLGEWSQQGWWYYDLVAFGVKAPLPLLALLLVSPWFLRRERLPRRELLALALPLLALVALLTLNRANIGVRYLLPIYPFLFVWIGCVANQRKQDSARLQSWRLLETRHSH